MAAAERKSTSSGAERPTEERRTADERHRQAGGPEPLLKALKANKDGVQGVRLSTRKAGIVGELGRAFNELAETRERTTKELVRAAKRKRATVAS